MRILVWFGKSKLLLMKLLWRLHQLCWLLRTLLLCFCLFLRASCRPSLLFAHFSSLIANCAVSTSDYLLTRTVAVIKFLTLAI